MRADFKERDSVLPLTLPVFFLFFNHLLWWETKPHSASHGTTAKTPCQEYPSWRDKCRAPGHERSSLNKKGWSDEEDFVTVTQREFCPVTIPNPSITIPADAPQKPTVAQTSNGVSTSLWISIWKVSSVKRRTVSFHLALLFAHLFPLRKKEPQSGELGYTE